MNQLAIDLGLAMRAWWTPDAAFLSALRRDQIVPIAVESGAAEHLHGLHDLVEARGKVLLNAAMASASWA